MNYNIKFLNVLLCSIFNEKVEIRIDIVVFIIIYTTMNNK